MSCHSDFESSIECCVYDKKTHKIAVADLNTLQKKNEVFIKETLTFTFITHYFVNFLKSFNRI